MNECEAVFKRITLKYVGTYLATGGIPGAYTETYDETYQEAGDKTYHAINDFLQNLEGIDSITKNRMLSAVNAHAGVNYRAGFLLGMKAGAKLILNLTDSSEVIL